MPIAPAVRGLSRATLVSSLLLCFACSEGQLAGPRQGGPADDDAHIGSCTPTAASLSADLFASSCNTSGCHSGGASAAAALDLTGTPELLIGRAAGTCDGWLLVAPGDPERSLLVRKLEGDVPEGCGDPMPPTGSLSAESIACVRDWIASLSPDASAPDPGCETCGGPSCVDFAQDPQHCGACGVSCGAGGTCDDGACSCPTGYVACASGCTELASDPMNCGACGTVCAAGELCTPSGCASLADCTLSVCGGACVDTQTSHQHCGGCGNLCPAGSTCEQGRCSCADRSVDFATDVAPVLVANCTNAGCHAGNRPKEGLDLSASKAYAELVNVQADQCSDGRLLVEPGRPEASYLLQKMLGVNMCSGTQMPKAGVSIPARDLEAITAWICQGAAR